MASSQTTGSWVSELRPGAIRHWVTATAAPCTSLFKPAAVEQPLDRFLTPAGHSGPTDRADDTSLWWRHERLHRRVMRDPQSLLAIYARERDELERTWLATPPEAATA